MPEFQYFHSIFRFETTHFETTSPFITMNATIMNFVNTEDDVVDMINDIFNLAFQCLDNKISVQKEVNKV